MSGLSLKISAKRARVGCLADVVDLLEDRAPELAIERPQVDELADVSTKREMTQITKRIVLRSMLTRRSMSGRWTLTATTWPVAGSTALWTWPSDAAAVAVGSSELKSSVTGSMQLRLRSPRRRG